MEIDINQQKIALGEKYRIYLDGQLTHVASQQAVQFRREVLLFAEDATQARMRLQKQWTWFSLAYNLTRWDHNVFLFRTESKWKNHYQCSYGEDLYDIYGHRGTKYSVYRNDTQIAWWDQDRVTWFAGDNFKIWADQSSNTELLMSFCLILDESSSESDNANTATVNLGYLGPEAKAFDESWRPK